jgi:hypothetical protein
VLSAVIGLSFPLKTTNVKDVLSITCFAIVDAIIFVDILPAIEVVTVL